MKPSTLSRSSFVKSQIGTLSRAFLSCFLKFPSQERYFGLVHGSTAPAASDLVTSGTTRFMSKSTVLPNPWHRGHAPAGELKLNRVGSGSANSMPQVLHWNRSLNRSCRPPAAFSTTAIQRAVPVQDLRHGTAR